MKINLSKQKITLIIAISLTGMLLVASLLGASMYSKHKEENNAKLIIENYQKELNKTKIEANSIDELKELKSQLNKTLENLKKEIKNIENTKYKSNYSSLIADIEMQIKSIESEIEIKEKEESDKLEKEKAEKEKAEAEKEKAEAEKIKQENEKVEETNSDSNYDESYNYDDNDNYYDNSNSNGSINPTPQPDPTPTPTPEPDPVPSTPQPAYGSVSFENPNWNVDWWWPNSKMIFSFSSDVGWYLAGGTISGGTNKEEFNKYAIPASTPTWNGKEGETYEVTVWVYLGDTW